MKARRWIVTWLAPAALIVWVSAMTAVAREQATLTPEPPRAVEPTGQALTFALEPLEAGGPPGVMVVSPNARYASAKGRGYERPTRLHLAGDQWRVVTTDLACVSSGAVVAESSTLARVVTDGRAVLRCLAVTELGVEPWAPTAALDALLAHPPE